MKTVIAAFCAITLLVLSPGCTKKDDPNAFPKVSILPAFSEEGGELKFEVHLSKTSADTVAFEFAIHDIETKSSDYAVGPEVVKIAPGQTGATIRIQALADRVSEGNETFSLVLLHPENCLFENDEALGTILNVPPGDPSPYYVSAKINGVAWKSDDFSAKLNANILTAIGTDGGSAFSFTFFKNPKAAQSYSIISDKPTSDASVSSFYGPQYMSTYVNGQIFKAQSGDFNITSYNSGTHLIQGTFALSAMDQNGALIQVTEGVFFIPYAD